MIIIRLHVGWGGGTLHPSEWAYEVTASWVELPTIIPIGSGELNMGIPSFSSNGS